MTNKPPTKKAKRPTSTDFAEVGSSGLVQYGGRVQEDFLRQLQGIKATATYREMADNHPVIGAILHAVEMQFRAVEWTVEPSDPGNDTAIAEAQFVAECMGDMSQSWADTLSNILSMLTYGFSVHEIVYKRRSGYADGGDSSGFNDGRIGWRKLPIRAQETIDSWRIDDTGGIEGVYQQDLSSARGRVEIPIKKMLLFRTTTKLNNPRGRSILRNAYVPWYYQRRILEIEAIGIERDLAGLPVAFVPPQLLSDNATAQESAALNAIKEIVRNIRRDEQEGLVFPLAYDPDTKQKAYDIQLMTTGGKRQFDTNAIATRYDARIAMSVLADFVMLGHDKVGTQALSVSKIALFQQSIAAWLTGVADVFNNHAIPRLMRLNGVSEDLHPTLTFSEPKSVDLTEMGDFVAKLTSSGALLPDESMANWLRGLAGIPDEEAEALA